MSQTIALLDTLKRILRMRGITYRRLADELAVSEASVKRLFSTGKVPLERLERICDVAGVSLVDLARQMEDRMRSTERLSEAQEREITQDPALLLVTFLVINGLDFADILHHYDFSEPQLIGYLATLDRLCLIELLPNNRFLLRISPHFAWHQDGPIHRFFRQHLQGDFLDSRFAGQGEGLRFLSAMLTAESRAVLCKRMEELEREFNELQLRDKQLSFEQRQLSSLILAVRPWQSELFSRYLRPGERG